MDLRMGQNPFELFLVSPSSTYEENISSKAFNQLAGSPH
jgi:hypothetical protein